MADELISREALVEALVEQQHICPTSYLMGFDKAIATAGRLPAADAAEVVRCKDCKLRCPESITVVRHCTLSGIPVDDDDFCSYGERREENAAD